MSSNKPKSFPSLDVVVGGQFGSEAKGRVTLERVRHRLAQGKYVGSMRVAGPNAGHVVIDPKGERFAMRSLPVGFIDVIHPIGVQQVEHEGVQPGRDR